LYCNKVLGRILQLPLQRRRQKKKLPVSETFSQFGARGPEGIAQTCEICDMMGNHIEEEF